jgi:hypothetical protein
MNGLGGFCTFGQYKQMYPAMEEVEGEPAYTLAVAMSAFAFWSIFHGANKVYRLYDDRIEFIPSAGEPYIVYAGNPYFGEILCHAGKLGWKEDV